MANPGRRDSLEQLTNDINRGIDDATQAILWCKRHLQERHTAETLRLAQLNLAYLALALDWQMEGEMGKAASALDHIWWHPYKDDGQSPEAPAG